MAFLRRSTVNRKRSAEDEDNQLKKAKLNRLNALIDDEPLPPTLPETAPDKDQLLDSASNISEIVASMKRQIEQRKKMLSEIFQILFWIFNKNYHHFAYANLCLSFKK